MSCLLLKRKGARILRTHKEVRRPYPKFIRRQTLINFTTETFRLPNFGEESSISLRFKTNCLRSKSRQFASQVVSPAQISPLRSSGQNKRQTQFFGSPVRHAITAVEETTPKRPLLDDSVPISEGELDTSPLSGER